jgi:hypothetical protein
MSHKQTNRKKDRKTKRQKDKKTERQKEKKKKRQKDKKTKRQKDKKTDSSISSFRKTHLLFLKTCLAQKINLI